jgi:hypothetical protein
MSQYFFNPLAVPYFISFVVSAALMLLLILKKREDRRVQLYIVFQGTLATLALMAAMASISEDIETWDKWERFINPVAVLGIITIWHFSYISLHDTDVIEDRRIAYLYILPLVFLAFALVNPNNKIAEFPDTELGHYGRDYLGNYAVFWPILRSMIFVILVLTTVNFVRMQRTAEDPTVRKQALYFTLSIFAPLVGFTISVLLVMFEVFINIQLVIVAFTFTGAIITYGILKHGLFDIEFIVRKTFIYSLIAFPLIGLFRLIELGISYVVSLTFFGGSIIIRLIAAAIVAAFFFPLRTYAVKLGDRLFPKFTETVKLDIGKEMKIYKKQLEHVLEDGQMSDKEAKMISSLRDDLGISQDAHERLVKEIESETD